MANISTNPSTLTIEELTARIKAMAAEIQAGGRFPDEFWPPDPLFLDDPGAVYESMGARFKASKVLEPGQVFLISTPSKIQYELPYSSVVQNDVSVLEIPEWEDDPKRQVYRMTVTKPREAEGEFVLKPTYVSPTYLQALGRVLRLLPKSRNQREGRYALKKEGRHVRKKVKELK